LKYIVTIILVLVALAIGAFLFAWSGIYNIAATEPHWNATILFIDTLRDRSIEARSNDIKTPDLNDPKLKDAAFPHYHEMCRLCHGAPGYPPEEFAEGLYPSPPLMMSGSIQRRLSEAEVYWVVKHGLKMTGMPGFGPTHGEEILWGLVALADEMPELSSEQYREMLEKEGSESEEGHERGEQEHGKEQSEPSPHGDSGQKRFL